MDQEAFIVDAWEVVGRKVSKERLLADIYQTAKSSVGLPIAQDSDAARMFRLVLGEGRSLIAQRNEIEDRAVELLKTNDDYQLLTSIPGIGPINALTILVEAGDLRRFQHHRQFLKFSGMDLATIQSGTFRGQTKLSKYGNARLRRTLWMAGQVAIMQKTNSYRVKFERYIAKDRQNTHYRIINRSTEGQSRNGPDAWDRHEEQTDLIVTCCLLHTAIQFTVCLITNRVKRLVPLPSLPKAHKRMQKRCAIGAVNTSLPTRCRVGLSLPCFRAHRLERIRSKFYVIKRGSCLRKFLLGAARCPNRTTANDLGYLRGFEVIQLVAN